MSLLQRSETYHVIAPFQSNFAQDAMTTLQIGLEQHGYSSSERPLTALVLKLQGSGFEFVEDLGGLNEHIISELDVSPEDSVFLQRVAAGVSAKASAARSSKRAANVEVPLLPVPVLQRVEDGVRNKRCATEVAGLGPTQALKRLTGAFSEGASKVEWLEQARLQALLGSCPHSHKSFQSGLRCYVAFAVKVLGLPGRELPPTIASLLAWSTLFRCAGTFSNYVGHVKLACQIAQVSTAAFDDRSLRRAKVSIAKRRAFIARKPMFICMPLLRDIIRIADVAGMPDAGMLFLTAYVFLLRLPSEALPIVHGVVGVGHGQQAIVVVEHDCIILKLARRKNKPEGSVLKRHCWCSQCEATCPVHVLGKYFSSLPVGAKPFASFTPATALKVLRGFLDRGDVPEARYYRTHDLRRGHARDLQTSGASLVEILLAGEWRSPAFLTYLDLAQLETDAVIEAHLAESSDDEQ